MNLATGKNIQVHTGYNIKNEIIWKIRKQHGDKNH